MAPETPITFHPLTVVHVSWLQKGQTGKALPQIPQQNAGIS